MPTPWPGRPQNLSGLSPGLHLLLGAASAGKTQWALQWALHAARAGVGVHFTSRFISEAEIKNRLSGLHHQKNWYQNPPQGGVAHFCQVPEDATFLVWEGPLDDPPPTAPICLWVLPGPAHLDLNLPYSLLLASFGLPEVILAQAASIWVLGPLPGREGWCPAPLVLAKNRYGVPGRIPLRFNGTWFEADDDELDLGVI